MSTVLPFDPIKKRILLLKQFRAGSLKRNHDPTMVEIVAGIIDVDESPSKEEIFRRYIGDDKNNVAGEYTQVVRDVIKEDNQKKVKKPAPRTNKGSNRLKVAICDVAGVMGRDLAVINGTLITY